VLLAIGGLLIAAIAAFLFSEHDAVEDRLPDVDD
jgi:hypothetical protein